MKKPISPPKSEKLTAIQSDRKIRKTIKKKPSPEPKARKQMFPLLNSLGSQSKILEYLPFNQQVSISRVNKAFNENIFSATLQKSIKVNSTNLSIEALIIEIKRVLSRFDPAAIKSIDFSEMMISIN